MSLPLAGGRLRLPSMGIGLWVAHVVDKTVMKLSLDGSLFGEIQLNLRPVALAVVEDDLWVLTAEGGGDRNGAIVVLSPSLETVATYLIERACRFCSTGGPSGYPTSGTRP